MELAQITNAIENMHQEKVDLAAQVTRLLKLLHETETERDKLKQELRHLKHDRRQADIAWECR